MKDPRLTNPLGPAVLMPIQDYLTIIQGLKTKFHQRLFLEEKIKDTRIDDGLLHYGTNPVYSDLSYFWAGVYFAKWGQYDPPPDGWTDPAKDSFYMGVIAWDNYCQLKQWLIDVEQGKALRIGNEKPTRREILTEAHKKNGGRLTSAEISQLAKENNIDVKGLQNFYAEILPDLK